MKIRLLFLAIFIIIILSILLSLFIAPFIKAQYTDFIIDCSHRNHSKSSVIKNSQYKNFDATGKILFIGDSIVEFGIWDELIPNQKILNRGAGSEATIDILDKIEMLTDSNPESVIIMAGINDFSQRCSSAETFINYKKIVENFLKDQKKVYIVSTLLCSPFYEKNCTDKLDRITRLNNHLYEYAHDNKNLIFIDSNSVMSESGVLIKNYTNDGIHLNSNGYKVLAKKIQESISK